MEKETALLGRLDTLAELIEDLIILQALRANIKGAAVRSFLGVDMNRVTQISKMLKGAKK